MELSFKQKLLVLGVMAALFLGSAFIKQGLLPGNDGAEETGIVSSAEQDSELGGGQSGKSSGAAVRELIVDVEGAVVCPGIIKIEDGSRVYEAVELAGGILDAADTRYVNLAEPVQDGTVIYIPYVGENQSESDGSGTSGSGLININTASKEELMTLPGIGESYAQAIIDYRESSGSFKSKEDIKNVSGIGDAKYAKLESLIAVY